VALPEEEAAEGAQPREDIGEALPTLEPQQQQPARASRVPNALRRLGREITEPQEKVDAQPAMSSPEARQAPGFVEFMTGIAALPPHPGLFDEDALIACAALMLVEA
jgi:hypothetical protein